MTTLQFIGTLVFDGAIIIGGIAFFVRLANEWWECEGRFQKRG